MKIAVVTEHIPSMWAHSINTMKHAQGFYDLGHEVEILNIIRVNEAIYRFKVRDIHEHYGINPQIKIKSFIDKSPLFFQEPLYIIQTKILAFKINRIINKILPRTKDILDPGTKISEYCKKKSFNFAYCRRAKIAAYYLILNQIPVVLEHHAVYPNYVLPQDLQILLKLKNNRYFKGIVTIHEAIKKQFLNHNVPKDKIFIYEDSVDLEKFDAISDNKNLLRKRMNIPLEKKIILYSGQLNEERGISTILEAVNILNNSEICVYLIGGNKKEKEKWINYIKKNDFKINVKMLGFLPNKVVPFYLKSADILLATYSLNVPTLKWMSPLKIFEYMASKTPFIATNFKRIREICNKKECLFTKSGDPVDLSKKIDLLLKDKELQLKLIEKSYNKVKNYTYKKRCKKILDNIHNNNYV